MIDAERMLGSLVRSAMSEGMGLGRGGLGGGRRRRRRRRGSVLGTAGKGALAMGALGVALGAWEHFSQKQAGAAGGAAGARQPPPPPPEPPPATPPPLPPPLPPLPPLPAAAAATTPAGDDGDGDALLLVRAMIAAANADHELDDDERGRILAALDEADAGDEDRAFLLSELENPIDLEALAERAATPELASQVYAASCLAIDIDNRSERNYLDRLARRLGLDPERAAELERQLGESAPADEPSETET